MWCLCGDDCGGWGDGMMMEVVVGVVSVAGGATDDQVQSANTKQSEPLQLSNDKHIYCTLVQISIEHQNHQHHHHHHHHHQQRCSARSHLPQTADDSWV